MSPILLFTGGYEGRIETLAFSPSANPPTLTRIASVESGEAPTWLTLTPDGRNMCSFRIAPVSLPELTSEPHSRQ
jgi:hypothetical protein